MHVTLIGGSGFIGSYLIRLMERESTIINIDKRAPQKTNTSEYRIADIREIHNLTDTMDSTDWLVLLAAEHSDNVDPVKLYYDVNVKGTQNVVDVAREKGINKILFTSSVAVYGLNKENPNEEAALDPYNHYGKSKAEAEKVLLNWYEEDKENRTLVIIRPTVVFGPGNRGNVYNLLQQIASGKFLMIGKGNNTKSMAYIGNITAFIRHCITSNLIGYHLFNYVDKPDLTTKQLIEIAGTTLSKKVAPITIPYVIGMGASYMFDIAGKLMGRTLPISSVRVKKFCATTQFLSINIAKTGFVPPFTLEDGLQLTIKHIMRKGDHTTTFEDDNYL